VPTLLPFGAVHSVQTRQASTSKAASVQPSGANTKAGSGVGAGTGVGAGAGIGGATSSSIPAYRGRELDEASAAFEQSVAMVWCSLFTLESAVLGLAPLGCGSVCEDLRLEDAVGTALEDAVDTALEDAVGIYDVARVEAWPHV
jgi:hypothetical protein